MIHSFSLRNVKDFEVQPEMPEMLQLVPTEIEEREREKKKNPKRKKPLDLHQ